MALIAASEEKGISVKMVSELTNCSRHHLAKLMDPLIKAKLVKAKRGQLGGFYLNKKPEQILLIDIIEAISGKINTDVLCPSGRNFCEGTSFMFGNLCKEIAEEFTTYLKSTSLADIKEKASSLLKKHQEQEQVH